jgi:hypothetical protein
VPDLKYVFPIPLLSINPSEIYSPKPDNPFFVILVSCNNRIPRKPSGLLFFHPLRFQRKLHLHLHQNFVIILLTRNYPKSDSGEMVQQ